MSENRELREPELIETAPDGDVPLNLPVTLGGVLDEGTLAKVRKVLTDGTPANTRRAYATDLRYFAAWRAASGFLETWPVPADVLIRFVVEQVEGMPQPVDEALVRQGFKKKAGSHSWSTIERRVAALATAHRMRGLPSPTAHPQVTEVVGRARRACVARGWVPQRKAAAERRVLEKMLATCDHRLVGIRDRALLLFGFATGGRRRSEISEATLERLQRVGGEFVYRMGRTKTEQEGSERPVPIAGKAAKALDKWLTASGIQAGPLFRAVWDSGTLMEEAISVDTVARIVKRRAELAGLDPEMFGGHSLRAGFMTEAGYRRISMIEAMNLSGHKDVATAAIYYRAGEVLRVEAGRMMDDGDDELAPASPLSTEDSVRPHTAAAGLVAPASGRDSQPIDAIGPANDTDRVGESAQVIDDLEMVAADKHESPPSSDCDIPSCEGPSAASEYRSSASPPADGFRPSFLSE
jgi:integrase